MAQCPAKRFSPKITKEAVAELGIVRLLLAVGNTVRTALASAAVADWPSTA